MKTKKFDLSVCLVGANEEHHLARLLPTLDWVNEIVYVDLESRDGSIKIAQKYHCRIFKKKNNLNPNINKEFGIKQAKSKWILYLDPDELLDDELTVEIKKIVELDSSYSAFWCKRINFYFVKFLKHGPYPDKQLRFFKNGMGYFPCTHIHERLKITGKCGEINGHMLHYSYLSIEEYFRKADFTTTFEAEYLKKQGVKINFFSFISFVILKPLDGFIRNFFFKKCFLDGFVGFVYSFLFGLHYIFRFLKLWLLYRKEEEKN